MSCKNRASMVGEGQRSSGVPGVGEGVDMQNNLAYPMRWREMCRATTAEEIGAWLTSAEREELVEYKLQMEGWTKTLSASRLEEGPTLRRHSYIHGPMPPEKNLSFFCRCVPGDLIRYDFEHMPFGEFASLAAQYGVEVEYVAPKDPDYKKHGSDLARVTKNTRHVPIAKPWMWWYWGVRDQMAAAEEAEAAVARQQERFAARLAAKGLLPSDLEAYRKPGTNYYSDELEVERARHRYEQSLRVARAIIENAKPLHGDELHPGDHILIRQTSPLHTEHGDVDRNVPVCIVEQTDSVFLVNRVVPSGTEKELLAVDRLSHYPFVTQKNAIRYAAHRQNVEDYQLQRQAHHDLVMKRGKEALRRSG